MFQSEKSGSEGGMDDEPRTMDGEVVDPATIEPRPGSLNYILAQATPERRKELVDTPSPEQFGGAQIVKATTELDTAT